MKIEPENWPAVHGRYKVGDPKSCVAVCTLKDIDLDIPLEKVAIAGPCMTENIGIERIIKNIITNRNIRYLILCGLEPKGHFVGQAIKSLFKNGVEHGRRITGAIGAMPFLKNITDSEVETFKKQVKIIDLIGVVEKGKIEEAIDECIKKDPGAFSYTHYEQKQEEVIHADYNPDKEWTADESPDKNWFVISVDHEKKKIIVEHYVGYKDNLKFCCKIVGDNAASIAGTIVKRKKVAGLYNAAYLGKELQKAEYALREGKEYVQERQ